MTLSPLAVVHRVYDVIYETAHVARYGSVKQFVSERYAFAAAAALINLCFIIAEGIPVNPV